ncbi:MAG TPA: hemolysin III family protein [Thermoanaerobaculia bacterium]|nr:hemolysin III family protein [Thermoanaerobaculia bacterium]
MTKLKTQCQYSAGEEIAHCTSHGFGLLLSIAGLVLLIDLALVRGGGRLVTACSVFGVTLILLYLASTLYHGIRHERAKRVLRVLDHSAIYLLIAGTYTPFCLVSLGGAWGWTLFGIVWGLAFLGISLKVMDIGRLRWLSIVLYVGMGWLVLVALDPMIAAVGKGGMWLLLLGGIAYTSGIVFYAWRRPYHHAIWHGFVLAGSILHFLAVLLYVIPPAG